MANKEADEAKWRVRAPGADGRMIDKGPFTKEEALKYAEEWRRTVPPKRLKKAWRALLKTYTHEQSMLAQIHGGASANGDDDEELWFHCEAHLEALASAARIGLYPSPRVLLGITASFEKYTKANGKLSLEEAFFGRPTRKAGNYSKRRHRERQLFDRNQFIAQLRVKTGKTLIAAAEELADRLEKKRPAGAKPLDPFSIAREYRANKGASLEATVRKIISGEPFGDEE